MHQPWRTFAAIINRCISGKTTGLDRLKSSRAQILWGMFYQKNVDYVALLWEDFMFQVDNKDISQARNEHMPYPRFTKVIISHFISKDKSISMRNMINLHTIRDNSLLGTLKFISKIDDYQKYGALIPNEMINQDIKDSKDYKTYLDFAIGKATPKKARKFKKVASPSKEVDILGVTVSKKKAPTKVDRCKGMDLLFEAVLLEAAQLIKALKKSKQDTHMLHASGLGDGVRSQPKVPDESKDKTTGTDEGTDSDDDSNDDDSDDEDDDVKSDADGDNKASDSHKTDSDKDDNCNLNQNDDEEEEYKEESYTTEFEKKAKDEKKRCIDLVEKSVKEIIKDEVKSQLSYGSDHEDANEHIKKVLEIMDLFDIPNITIDQVMLRAFPMSSTEATSRWLRNKPSGSITTLEDLKTKFLSKYWPPARIAKKMKEINNFQQEMDEYLYQDYERLIKCPQHYLIEMQEVVLFYNGLDVPTRQILDSKGAIPSKTAADAKVAIQEMVEYSQKWHNGTSRTRSTETSDGLAAIQAQRNNLGREIKKVNKKVYVA
nr:hypothetical protein [Tanacetum cinerariifolium]